MKQLKNLLIAAFMLLAVYTFVALGTHNELAASAVTISLGLFSAVMHLKGIGGMAYSTVVIPNFTEKTAEEFDELTAEQRSAYYQEKKAYDTAIRQKEIQEQIDTFKKESETEHKSAIELLTTKMNALAEELAVSNLKFQAAIERPGKGNEQKGLRQYLEENSEVLKHIKEAGKQGKTPEKSISFDYAEKGLEGAADIGGRDYLGTIDPVIGRKPVRKPLIMDLFRRKSVNSEYMHYWEENVVTRDAKFVIACATSTHTTKKTWAKRTVELAKIRDIVDVCLDMLDDYTFVESELRQLIDESIKLKADYELLLGLSVATTDMLSINSIASVFNPANPLADYSAKFQAATIGDLTAAMKGQIYTFGQENMWQADTVLMNYTDMITYLHAKDANNNYLFPNFVLGATDMVNGMRIVTSPIVAQNTLFVFDSTKGTILDRRRITIATSYENRDNIEHELVTFVGNERLQFHVKLIDRDAFMKVTDIEAALAAITAVPAP